MSEIDGDISYQCWICPYCFDDHRSDGSCKESDLKIRIEKQQEAIKVLRSTLKEAEGIIRYYGNKNNWFFVKKGDRNKAKINVNDRQEMSIYENNELKEIIPVGGKHARLWLAKFEKTKVEAKDCLEKWGVR